MLNQQSKTARIKFKLRSKEPYLRDILKAAQTNSPLDKNYTASDILTVLEELDDFVNNL